MSAMARWADGPRNDQGRITVNSDAATLLTVQVTAIRLEAEAIFSIELALPGSAQLPPASAGAHIDVMLPGGMERSYSLIESGDALTRYVIAVKREAESRGGSVYLCDVLRVGQTLQIKPPQNAFALAGSEAPAILIAGGIGITPILSMIRALAAKGQGWTLYYAARRREDAAFLDELSVLATCSAGQVYTRFSDAPCADDFTISGVLEAAPASSHIYCCGPARMLDAVATIGVHYEPDRIHMEYFAASQDAAGGGFEVVLARSGKSVMIPADRTILETLVEMGMTHLPRSCMEGVCGTCETVVLEGIPDHRDNVLTARERRANNKMIICRSGSLSEKIVLDL